MAQNPVSTAPAYGPEQIKVLKGLEAVRLRPGMYVGGTDIKALHHLVYEVVDNSIDEAMAGVCTNIDVTIHSDGSISVVDNGRGIPVGIHPDVGISTLTVVLTMLHAGGKFGDGGYKVTGGLHGVGVSAVNALSSVLIAEIYRDGYIWRQRFERGYPVTDVEQIGETDLTGTKITFWADETIFPETDFKYDTLLNRFREMAFVTRGVNMTLRDERTLPLPREHSFYFEGGITSFTRYLNRNRKALHNVVYADKVYDLEGTNAQVEVEVAIQYADYFSESILTFANTINTPDGGTHLEGLRAAITRAVNYYARKAGVLKDNDPNFTGDDTYEGLTAIVSVKHPNPQFESQTKVKLMNNEVKGFVQSLVNEAFGEFLQMDTRAAKLIYEKCLISSRARIASKRARDLIRSSPLQSTTLPGKLADCSSSDPSASEMYIVEGDSAGGCFAGDTRIALVDGRTISFEELVDEQAQGKEHFCYTIRKDGTVGVERVINARITKQNTEVIRVTLDNGESIVCTPDHRFMLRDGSYKAAAQLTPDDSLMPHYVEIAETYNHRIVSIEQLDQPIDVYDIEVPNTHNFALASGVFVHNSAKQGRDRHFQAILPLRGKILNTERARLDKVLENREVQALISALGIGIGEDMDIERLRYHRIIIMTDADVDGAHIRTLLLTFFFRYMPILIEGGHLYIAQPPLYLIKHKKEKIYAYSDEEKNQILKRLGEKAELQRYKGLGEMNPDQLWETTMDPANRVLLRVAIEDAAAAERTFDMLMGASVPPRRKFIQTHAKSVRNLDV